MAMITSYYSREKNLSILERRMPELIRQRFDSDFEEFLGTDPIKKLIKILNGTQSQAYGALVGIQTYGFILGDPCADVEALLVCLEVL